MMKNMFLTTVLSILLSINLIFAQEEKKIKDFKDFEEISLEELLNVVIAAARHEQKLSEAPSSVTIITAKDIEQYGYRTLADALDHVEGFFITYDRNYQYVGVRGFARPGDYSTRVLVMVNGHYYNDNVFGASYIGTDFGIDMDMVKRIEIVRGPASALYGTNALFAVINVITKETQDYAGLRTSVEIGSFGKKKGIFSYGKKFGVGLELLITASLMDTKGQTLYFSEFDDPATNYGYAQNADGDKSSQLWAHLAWGEITLQASFNNRIKRIPTAPWGSIFNDNRTKTKDSRRFIELKYAHQMDKGKDIMIRTYYDQLRYEGVYPADYPPVTEFMDLGHGNWYGAELQFNWKVLQRSRLILGGEYQNHTKVYQRAWDKEPFYEYFNDRRSFNIWSLYLQEEFQPRENLNLILGVRHDDYPTFGGTTNPRFAAIYNPIANSTLKLLYGEAFRAPNSYETYYDDSGESMKANPKLKPEKIKTYELIFEQGIGKNMTVIIAGYHYHVSDLINQVTDPSDSLLQYQNVDHVEANGLELSLRGRWRNGIRGRISYVFQKAKDRTTDEELTNSPGRSGNLGMVFPFFNNKIFLATEMRYLGRRLTLGGNHTTPSYITDLTLSTKNFLKALDISVSIYNLFDYKYADPGSGEHLQDVIPQDGRNYQIKVTYHLGL